MIQKATKMILKIYKVDNQRLFNLSRMTNNLLCFAVIIILILPTFVWGEYKHSGNLEIHYINVGQGTAVLIIGPNGTRIIYDFGWLTGKNNPIVPYLKKTVKLKPEDGLHYSIVSHRDSDHYYGYLDVINAGYDILIANYEAGSKKKETPNIRRRWLIPAKKTKAGPVEIIPVGLNISLGNGAEAIVLAANGEVLGHNEKIRVSNENDRSIALFIHYKNFQFILDGDLGAGPEICTQHKTTQKNIEEYVAKALIDMNLIKETRGVDVMHVAHHGSESSTSAAYYNIMRPEVGIIAVGLNQGNFRHPRKFVVQNVLLGINRSDCVKAPALKLLLQTNDGIEGKCEHCGSNIGRTVGDIRIITDGSTDYRIQVSHCIMRQDEEGRFNGFAKDPSEAEMGIGWVCSFDENEEINSEQCLEIELEPNQIMTPWCQ